MLLDHFWHAHCSWGNSVPDLKSRTEFQQSTNWYRTILIFLTISKLILYSTKIRHNTRVDEVDYHMVCPNIDILAMQALFVMEFSPSSTHNITIISQLFSNLIPVLTNLNQNLEGFIEPPCIWLKLNGTHQNTLLINPGQFLKGKFGIEAYHHT